MKKLIGLSIFTVLMLMTHGMAVGGSGSRLLKEIVGSDQKLEWARSNPVLISKKEYNLAITPKTILLPSKELIKFTLVIYNTKEEPLAFSLENIRIYSGDKNFELLPEETLLANEKREILKDYSRLSKEALKPLAPFIEDKLNRLRVQLLKKQSIPPKKRLEGLFAIDPPMKTKKVTIEITTPKDKHIFNFSLIDL